MSENRRGALFVCALALVVAATLLAAAVRADPAQAYEDWVHDGATCSSCHGSGQQPTDATCTSCHTNFTSFPDRTCWSCHAPGQDTTPLSTPSAACSQGCHLWNRPLKAYSIDFTHGEQPHLGASGFGKTCLDCHSTSVNIADPGASPHHSGQPTGSPSCQDCHDGVRASAQVTHDARACTSCHDGMNIPPVPATCNKCHSTTTFGTADCRRCHAGLIHNTKPNADVCSRCHQGYNRHAGKVGCKTCHTKTAPFHHDKSKTTAAKKCRSCHAKKHAGRRVAGDKCASCHKGGSPRAKPRAQHSNKVSRRYACGVCHSKALHAKSAGSGITTCRRCHGARFHRAQPRPSASVCTCCHTRAPGHAVGFYCSVCHRSAIHAARPGA